MNVPSFDDFAYNVSSTATEIAHETSDNLKKSINLENHVNSTSYSELKEMVFSANELVNKLYESKDILVRFECEPINHLNIFWRLTTVVNCTITQISTTSILSQRVLGFRQFFVLYQEIKRFSQLPTTTINNSIKPISDETCLLCCDACPSSILPCGHNFCRKCIDAWFKASFKLPSERSEYFSSSRRSQSYSELKNRQQCPLCRGPCPRSKEAWDFLDCPDPSECRNEMASVLLNLIFNAGSPLRDSESHK
ncbi:unnamed protein product [Hymenolepis diminuta]|uniref:RING-type domain-containing protein n=1 Tax=Hymenolepis diminuta TaxID=6216 RepID=A0A564YQ06_HYMDI|nr:unnamed protein product [Hymenolepis diminuta]